MSSFDTLVSGISQEERKEILGRMKDSAGTASVDMNVPDKLSIQQEATDIKAAIEKLSVFERLMLWIKSTFASISIEEAYNRNRISAYAHEIDRQHVGLIDVRHRTVQEPLLMQLGSLQKAAHFFEPYVAGYERNPGAFLVLLSSLVIPGEYAQIEADADPYAYPFTSDLDPELRSNLIKKMDEAINAIPEEFKKLMYASVRGVEWLKSFSRIPFEHIMSKFAADATGQKTCRFESLAVDFSELSGILCHAPSIPDEVLEAMYLFSVRQQASSGTVPEAYSQGQVAEFMENATSEMTVISSFIRTVPMQKLTCVLTNKVQFSPRAQTGGEDWFVRFRTEWKHLFDQRWQQWMSDFEKERLKQDIAQGFGYETFPLFPYRPWTAVWDGIPFRYELSLGFLHAFFKDSMTTYMKTLKVVSIEGEFTIKENRVEFTDTCNLLFRLNDDMDVLATQLSAGGEFGLLFSKYEGASSKKSGEIKSVRDAMKQVEYTAGSLIRRSVEAFQSMNNLLAGVLSERITSYYGPLANLARIQVKEGKNKAFVQALKECARGIRLAHEVLTALEPLELPTAFVP